MTNAPSPSQSARRQRLTLRRLLIAMLVALATGVGLAAVDAPDTTPIETGDEAEGQSQGSSQDAPTGVGVLPPRTQASLTQTSRVAVLIEMQEQPGALTFASVLAQRGTRDGAAMAAAATAARTQIDAVGAEQARVSAIIEGPQFNADEIFRVRRAMNAIAANVDSEDLTALSRVPGVKSVRILELEYPGNSSSVPYVGAPAAWGNDMGAGMSVTGTGVRVGVIDTGIDYQHATFGGTGALAPYQANDRTVISDGDGGTPFFPTAKVVGGFDFAGDAYTGASPAPDPDPMDCNGHGSHVAGTTAGLGVRSDGTTFTGPFDSSVPFGGLRIGPGTAPGASLYALRVFGCGGGTNLTVQAIDWAMDPNGDNDLSDHLDVINMSLGSAFGALATTSAIAADNAAAAGVIVVASAGNHGDTYFINGAPGSGSRVISVAASADGGQPGPGLRVNAPAGVQGNYVATTAQFGPVPPPGGVSGNVVLGLDASDAAGPLTTDGCSPLTNAAEVAGNVAMIDRGTCGFAIKVATAQAAGAIAVVIANSAAGAFNNMGGVDPTIVIPSVMITFADANLLKASIPGLNVTLANGGDTMAGFSSRGPRRNGNVITMKPDIIAPGVAISSAQTGVTCTGGGGSAGCQVPNASGFISDSQPLLLQGTSMSSPHVAGVMALLRQLHPTWTVEEMKALVMNRALHDVHVFPGNSGARFGPGRVGAGRVDAALAVQSNVVAFNADAVGEVNVSFDGVVSGSVTRTRRVRLVNHGATPQTYQAAVDTVVDAPGVSFSVPGGGSVTVPGGGSIVIDVQMTADAGLMDRSRDATVTGTQTAPPSPASVAGLGALERHALTEEAGYLTFAQGGVTQLRVPLYTAPIPVSTMTAADQLVTGGAPTGATTLSLAGTDVCTGTAGPGACGVGATDVVSLVTPFELQVASPSNPANAPPTADLQYAGVAFAPGATDHVLFGVSTWGEWSTPTETAFNIYVDCGVYTLGASFGADTCPGNPDGIYDLVAFNTNPGNLAQLFGVSSNTAPSQDSFLTAVFVVSRNSVVFGPVNYLNRIGGLTLDSRLFNSNAAFLAVDRTRLKLSPGEGRFNYRILTCPGTQPLCRALSGFHFDEAPGPYGWDYEIQGLNFGGTNLAQDLNGGSLPVSWNTANLTTNGSLGALLLHHHNAPGQQAEVVLMDTAQQTDLGITMTASPAAPAQHEPTTLTLTVTNYGPAAATNVQVTTDIAPGLIYQSDNGGGAYDPGLGLWTIGSLATSATATLQIVVEPSVAEALSAKAIITTTTPLDAVPANNQAILGVAPPPQADVEITAAATASPVVAGGVAGYVVTVRNNGTAPAYSVSVANNLTGSGTVLSGTPSAGLFNGTTREWTIASLASGGAATLTVAATAHAGPSLSLVAQASSSVTDPQPTNNSAMDTVLVTARATETTILLDPAAGSVGDSVNAIVTVRDAEGSGTASNPAGTIAFNSSSGGDVFTPASCVLAPVPSMTDRSQCQVAVVPGVAGVHSITGTYAGTTTHLGGAASADLTVEKLPTTTAAENATVVASPDAQPILLAATVTSRRTVDEGVVTFTLRDSEDAVVGSPTASAPLTDGTAQASYTLPAGTGPQVLKIVAEYAGVDVFANSSDDTKTVTIEPPTLTYFLAEGSTGGFFDLDLLIANPNSDPAPVDITFYKESGATVTETRTLPPTSRTTIRVDDITGLGATAVSTLVASTDGLPLVVERTMRWDNSGYGAHTEKASPQAASTWYFAEGSQGFFSTYLLLVNPSTTINTAQVTFFREGSTAVTKSYDVAPLSRLTISAGSVPELVNRSFGMKVEFEEPGVAERAMYFGTDPFWSGGHDAAGATELAMNWFLAEGATGSYFSTFLLLANPNADPATVTVSYLPAAGSVVTKTHTVAGNSRLTLNVAFEDPTLVSAAVGATVTSTRPIVVERAQYWPQLTWTEGHANTGITAPGLKWGLAEGRVGGAAHEQTYILIANPGTQAAEVAIQFLKADGTTFIKNFLVEPESRLNVAVTGPGSNVPELVDEAFGAVITASKPIVVERSMYSDANGVIWAAGTSASATRLP